MTAVSLMLKLTAVVTANHGPSTTPLDSPSVSPPSLPLAKLSTPKNAHLAPVWSKVLSSSKCWDFSSKLEPSIQTTNTMLGSLLGTTVKLLSTQMVAQKGNAVVSNHLGSHTGQLTGNAVVPSP